MSRCELFRNPICKYLHHHHLIHDCHYLEFCWFPEDDRLPFHFKVVHSCHSVACCLFPNNKKKGDIIRGDFLGSE